MYLNNGNKNILLKLITSTIKQLSLHYLIVIIKKCWNESITIQTHLWRDNKVAAVCLLQLCSQYLQRLCVHCIMSQIHIVY